MKVENIFICPSCNYELRIKPTKTYCTQCKTTFKSEEGIPLLFWSNNWHSKKDVTDEVKSFYEKTPFPNYNSIDSIETLREKAREGIFQRSLDEQIPYGSRILEVGCGTGQLSNLLGSTWGRSVYAVDMCLNSLKLGNNFRKKAKINNTSFFQMNLFKPIFKEESFDYVISNGVLHHTSDPFLAFLTISKLIKPGGYIIVGLYNRYGRKSTDLRRIIFRLTGGKFKFLDPFLRNKNLSLVKKDAWYKDQYLHPRESEHTIDEVLNWFDQTNIEFINSIPKPGVGSHFSENENFFLKTDKGTKLDHFLVQTGMILSGGKEGGFFVMIGRKK